MGGVKSRTGEQPQLIATTRANRRTFAVWSLPWQPRCVPESAEPTFMRKDCDLRARRRAEREPVVGVLGVPLGRARFGLRVIQSVRERFAACGLKTPDCGPVLSLGSEKERVTWVELRDHL